MQHSDSEQGGRKSVSRLAIASIGIVYGDIGTSPLYTLKECFTGAHGLVPDAKNILGLLSLVLWALIVIVTIKYVLFIMRADNKGEGGILALMSLATSGLDKGAAIVTGLGLFGAALFFGDSVITPAISILSAVEGLTVVGPIPHAWVIGIALVVLVGLFAFQYMGTDRVGAWFGPIMLLWFATLAVLGLINIVHHPSVLAAFDPRYAVRFFTENGFAGFVALGAVFLAVTGGEALYADMGHFGRRPVQLAWLLFVLPSLMLNYLGQSALVLVNPSAVSNPFYLMAPSWLLVALVALATVATVIASQAVISGAFSVTRQAIQLGFCPRMEIRHTSEHQSGQIYMPQVNERLLMGVVILVLLFESSANLAAAYGIAVTGTMAATTLLAWVVVRKLWGWPLLPSVAVIGVFLAVDLAFLGANLLKLFQGGWVPLLIGISLYTLMRTWRDGRVILAGKLRDSSLPTELFLKRVDVKPPLRVPGTAIYLTRHSDMLPHALLHNLKHNKVLHEKVILLTVETQPVPRVNRRGRLATHQLRSDFSHVYLRYGFMETPNIPEALREMKDGGLDVDAIDTSFFLGRETLIPSPVPPLSRWRERLFILLSRNAVSGTDFFHIPAGKVVELGAQVPL
ncbi:MAG: potassium transporter Kup [Rhodospirillales bacterium]|nr:potassium transporter Kup [Rhodospirillales bacterium]